MSKLILSEPYHKVIQGEGNLIGKKMLLFRVFGCNVRCTNCDSKHTFSKDTPTISYTEEEFIELINIEKIQSQYDYVMITGGAPSLYKDFLYRVIASTPHINFQIEDAGDTDWSSFKHLDNVWFSFSPKIGSLLGTTGITEWEAFENAPKNWICKVVVSVENWEHNFNSIIEFQAKYNIPNDKVYLMPFGVHRETIIDESKVLIEKCWEHKFNFSPRLHVLLFDDKKLV